MGIPGNEKADSLAKKGTKIAVPTAVVGTPWCEVVSAISDWMGRENGMDGIDGIKRS